MDELLTLLSVEVVLELCVLLDDWLLAEDVLEEDLLLVELLLDEELSSSSWRPNTVTENTTLPPLAVNLMFFLVEDKSMPPADRAIRTSESVAASDPPSAVVRIPSAVNPFAAPGSISKCPVPSETLITMATISSNRHASPKPSLPDPAPISKPTIWYRSSVWLAPDDSAKSPLAHARLNWSASMPSRSVTEKSPPTAQVAWVPLSRVLTSVDSSVSLILPLALRFIAAHRF